MRELRRWSDGLECLYTDETPVLDRARKVSDLQVVSTYFKGANAARPFAWDIVGTPTIVRDLAGERAVRQARSV